MRHRSKSSTLRHSEVGLFAPRLNWWHGLFFALGIFLGAGFHILFPSISFAFPLKSLAIPARNTALPPWGELQYTTLKLERPDESFPATWPAPRPIQWVFQNFSQEQLQTFIATADLAPEHKTLLLDKSRWIFLPVGSQITPPIEVVRDINAAARKAIYSVLRQNSQNSFLDNPGRFDPEKFESWVAESGLPAEKQHLLRKLAIREGNSIYFYDALLMEWLCSPEERKTLGKALSQTPALLMKLHITPESDINRLLRYWGRAGRGQAMKPLLDSLDNISGGVNLNVAFFFPTFARMRLYTFPDPNNARSIAQQDCFWTALNFFNETPDYSLMNHDDFLAKFKAEYVEVARDFAFGDVIALIDGQKKVVHMCVYIADDVVFTKNGASPLSPWVLMRQHEMMKQYASEQALRLRLFRKKSMAAADDNLATVEH